MNDRQKQFLTLYRTLRHKDQAKFYQMRCDEFDRAHNQAVYLAAGLMALTAIASLLTPVVSLEPKWIWPVLGVLLPALSTALTAYNSLYSFEPQSKLYHDAMLALRKAEAISIDAEQAPEAEAEAKLAAYVNQVEEILRKEQGQWGQLISQLKPVEAPQRAETAQSTETPPAPGKEQATDASKPPKAADAAGTTDDSQTSEASETSEAGKPNEKAG